MKYFWVAGAFVFIIIVLYQAIINKTWDSINALWALVCFLGFDIEQLKDEIK